MSDFTMETLQGIGQAVRTYTGLSEGDCPITFQDLPTYFSAAPTFIFKDSTYDNILDGTQLSYETNVTNFKYSPFAGIDTLVSVKFTSATSIPYQAFKDCIQLTRISFPSLTRLSTQAFENTALTSIALPGLTDLTYTEVFKNCGALHTVTISSVSSITVGTSMFEGTPSLTSIYGPSTISTIHSSAFRQSNWYDENLFTSEGPEVGKYAFAENSGVTSVQKGPSRMTGSGTYYACWNLASVTLSSWWASTGGQFVNCTVLTSFELNSLATSGAYLAPFYYENFTECSSLQSFIINATSFTAQNVPFRENFQGCTSLSEVILNTGAFISLTATTAFNDTLIAQGQGYIYVPDALVSDYKAATNWSNFANQIKGISEVV